MDGCPGRLNQNGATVATLLSMYGQCSEICGVNHAFMPIQYFGSTLEEMEAKERTFYNGLTYKEAYATDDTFDNRTLNSERHMYDGLTEKEYHAKNLKEYFQKYGE